MSPILIFFLIALLYLNVTAMIPGCGVSVVIIFRMVSGEAMAAISLVATTIVGDGQVGADVGITTTLTSFNGSPFVTRDC